MMKDAAMHAACKGNANTVDGGRKLWMAWERGMLGATVPDTPIENPEPFRMVAARAERIARRVDLHEDYKVWRDSYYRPRDWPAIEPVDLSNAVRHLTFHIWPVAGFRAWQWNCDRLMERAELFNGRRIVSIVTSAETDAAETVKEYLKDFTDEFIVQPNNHHLREVATWIPMLRRLEEYQSVNDVTFSCHGKCVRHHLNPDVVGSTIFDWTKAMYDTCLAWDVVQPLLERFATAGSFRRIQAHMVGRGGFGPWHYSGAFFWWRNRDAFCRNWRYVPSQFFGTEAWPGIMFSNNESGVILGDNVGDLYLREYWDSEIEPALKTWKEQNVKSAL